MPLPLEKRRNKAQEGGERLVGALRLKFIQGVPALHALAPTSPLRFGVPTQGSYPEMHSLRPRACPVYMSLPVLAPRSDSPSQKSPWVDLTISTLGEITAGILFQEWCMTHCYKLPSLSRNSVAASKPSVLSFTLVAQRPAGIQPWASQQARLQQCACVRYILLPQPEMIPG